MKVYYNGTLKEYLSQVKQIYREPEFTRYRVTFITSGDIDGDGEITALDALLLREYFVKLTEFSNYEQARADVNRDGVVNAHDQLLLRRIIAGLAK